MFEDLFVFSDAVVKDFSQLRFRNKTNLLIDLLHVQYSSSLYESTLIKCRVDGCNHVLNKRVTDRKDCLLSKTTDTFLCQACGNKKCSICFICSYSNSSILAKEKKRKTIKSKKTKKTIIFFSSINIIRNINLFIRKKCNKYK